MIGKADLEFYYGGLVRRTAIMLSGCHEFSWEALSHRSKQHWLDKSIETLQHLIQEPEMLVLAKRYEKQT